MTPAKQLYTDIGGEPVGDCLRTCVAMILDLEPQHVPHFVQEYLRYPDAQMRTWPGFEDQLVTVPRWAAACQGWLRNRGFQMATFGGPPEGYTGWAIATGPSPRGDFSHAVVVYTVSKDDGGYEWRNAADPHPSNDYLAGEPTEFAVIERSSNA